MEKFDYPTDDEAKSDLDKAEQDALQKK